MDKFLWSNTVKPYLRIWGGPNMTYIEPWPLKTPIGWNFNFFQKIEALIVEPWLVGNFLNTFLQLSYLQ
jgi:hypothetical protein